MPKKNRAQDAWHDVANGDAVVRGLAEMLGTALLVMMCCMGCLGGWESGAPPPVQYSLGAGIVVMFVVQIFGHVSGAHVNPSVTVAALIFRTISVPMAAVYLLAQCLGAILGYGLLLVVTPERAFDNSTSFCVTMPNASVSSGQAVIIEAIITGILCLLACSVWDYRNSHNTDGIALKFGLTVATIVMAAGSYTGASMNPARSLGPAIWTNEWSGHWIYWIGPLLGASISTLLYCNVFKKDPPISDPREEEPLREIHGKAGGTSTLENVELQR